jgi:protein TonB
MNPLSLLLVSVIWLVMGNWFLQNASLKPLPKSSGDVSQEDRPWGPSQLRVNERVSQALLLKKVEPDYPEQARQKNIKGDVQVALIVDRQGNVSKAKRISGDPMLGPAAVAAVKQYKYKPYLLNREPIEFETTATVKFK